MIACVRAAMIPFTYRDSIEHCLLRSLRTPTNYISGSLVCRCWCLCGSRYNGSIYPPVPPLES